LPPNSVSIEGSEGQNHLNFDLAVAAFDDNSKKGQPPAVTIGRTITTAVPDAQMAALRNTGIGMKNTIALGPGQYTVRVVIRDNVTGKIGSVTTPLIVD
jgi:hypothetical protein